MKMAPEKFFSLLFRQVDKSYKMLFVAKKGNQLKSAGRHTPGVDLSEVIGRITSAKADGYFHCGVDLAQERNLRCRIVDVDGVGFLWVDVDKALSPAELEAIQKDEFRPTLMVCSGRGYHLYWILSAWQPNKKGATEANRWLSKRFGGDTGVDVARLLRIPGTYNYKDPENPKLVEVVWFDCDEGGFPHEWDFEKFGRLEGAELTNAMDRESIVHVQLGDFLDRIDSATRDLVTSRIGVSDRSARDFNLCNTLAQQGFDENHIFSVLSHPVWASGDKGRDNVPYAKKQAAEAVARVKQRLSIIESIDRAFEVAVTPAVTVGSDGGEKLGVRGSTATQPVGSSVAVVDPLAKAALLKEKRLAAQAEARRLKQEAWAKAKANREPSSYDSLRERIYEIHADVLQVDGSYRRGNKQAPQLGGEFGRQVAQVFSEFGFRFVRDMEHEKNYIADRKGKIWDAAGDSFPEFIKEVTGYAENQKEFSFIAGGIVSYIETNGEKIRIGRWAHYDKVSGAYYLLGDDATGLVYIIDSAGQVSESYNGEGDVFLRPRLQPALPLRLDPEVSEREGVLLLEQSFTRYIAGTQATRRLMTCFSLASVLAYGSPVMTFPLLHLTGPSGKGKSHTLGLMTSLLFGYYQLLTYTTAAAFRVVSTETLVAIDDKEELSQSLEEYCLLASTAATRGICKSENQQGVVLQKTHVINAITSIEALRTVPLRRRALVVEINKELFPSEEVLKKKGIDNIIANRDKIWSGLAPVIGRVAAALQNGDFDAVSERVYQAILVDDFRGQTDFLSLMLIIERELYRAVGRPFDEMQTLQDFMEVTRLNDSLEVTGRDPLILSLESFFEKLFEEKTTEMYDLADTPGSSIKLVTVHRMENMAWSLTTEEENAKVAEELGCAVRGIKASATGWVSIFNKDTSVFGRSIKSPTSLGVQFGRLLGKKDGSFFIRKGKTRGLGRVWCVYQKIGD